MLDDMYPPLYRQRDSIHKSSWRIKYMASFSNRLSSEIMKLCYSVWCARSFSTLDTIRGRFLKATRVDLRPNPFTSHSSGLMLQQLTKDMEALRKTLMQCENTTLFKGSARWFSVDWQTDNVKNVIFREARPSLTPRHRQVSYFSLLFKCTCLIYVMNYISIWFTFWINRFRLDTGLLALIFKKKKC